MARPPAMPPRTCWPRSSPCAPAAWRAAKNDAFKLTRRGQILWRDEEIARLEAGDDPLKPTVVLTADEHLSAPDKEKVKERLVAWIAEIVGERLKPLVEIAAAKDIRGLARGIAFRLSENFGALRREAVAEEMRALDQPARAQLRNYGVRFGAFNIYFPALLKPASCRTGPRALGPEERSRAWPRHRRHARPAACRPDIARRRQGGAGGLLSRHRVPRLRASRGADRHARAACRPNTAVGGLARRPGKPQVRPPKGRRATAASGQPRR